MPKILISCFICGMAFLLTSSEKSTLITVHQVNALDTTALAERYKDSFAIGAALETKHLEGRSAEVIKYHFNSIAAENAMKAPNIQPEEGIFNFEETDKIVSFAKEHNMEIRFHTLVWHSEMPDWFVLDKEGNPMIEETDPLKQEENKRLLLERLENHIRMIATRYRDDIKYWDVVNEVIDEDAGNSWKLRESLWYDLTGIDYIKTAFRTTKQYAGKDAKLFINEFDTEMEPKRSYLLNLVKELVAEGVPIDGVGHQSHYTIGWPPLKEIEETILLFSSFGLDNQITELDVSIYSSNPEQIFISEEQIPEKTLQDQAKYYDDLFKLYEKLDGQISSITFWGFADDHTWLDFRAQQLSGGPAKDAPFVFDSYYNVKPAYWAIVD
ncbi:endo-1,4-beta-xylanase [Planococcus shenhongbingii]|uniref:Beta-xylanase n=1 Tax=Planococcus shenhongbingii TaxID=3058398 RepID=A0ABT8NA10_9BACL|nr:endo-1,4-beta-xylanase [Planococcus sp. N017]MDN7244726.1 endo-1,4-beta-xylanase [Planococcus sp. N017]